MFFNKLRKQIEDYTQSTEKLSCQICLLREDIKNLNSLLGKMQYFTYQIEKDAEEKYKKIVEEKVQKIKS